MKQGQKLTETTGTVTKTRGFQKGQKLTETTPKSAVDIFVRETLSNPDKMFKQNVLEGNPIPHVNPMDAALSTAKEAIQNGRDFTTQEIKAVKKYGISSVLPDSATAEYDIFADNNPLNKARLERVKTIIAKQNKGESITEDENNTLETFKLINEYKKSGGKASGTLESKLHSKDSALMTGNTTENAYKMQDVKAKKLYNDATYGNDTIKIGNKEYAVNEGDTTAKALRAVQNAGKRTDLYINAGLEQYAQGLNTTADVLTGKSPEKIADSPYGAYSTANAMLKQYYTEHGEELNSIIQDTVTNIANNAPGMVVGAATGVPFLGQATFGISVFGNAYKEGTKLGIYDPTRLLGYSLATTASEVGLEYLIGGLPGVGGVLSGEVIEGLSKNVSSAIAKAATKVVGNALGEFIEEGTQSLLSPILQKYILGADVETVVDDPLGALSDAAYEGFIGALTSVLTGGIGSYTEAIYERNIQASGKYYKQTFSQNGADVKNVAKFFEESSADKSKVKEFATAVTKGDTSDLAVGRMMIAVARETQESNKALFTRIGENVRNSEGGIAAVVSSYEKAVNENKSIFPDEVEKLYKEVSGSENTSDELVGEFALKVETYAPRAAIMGDIVGKTFGAETETELAGTEGASTDAEVAPGTDGDDNSVLHDPEIGDIATKLDMFDTYKGSDGEQHLKTSRHKHIESTVEKTGAKLIWSSNVSRGKYIPSTKTIMLNPEMNTSEAYNFVLKHEFTHYLESKKGYAEFKDYVFNNSRFFEDWAREKLEKAGVSAEGSRKQIIKRLTEVYFNEYTHSAELSEYLRKKFAMSDAEEEILADFVGENLLGAKEKLDETLHMLSELKQKKRGLFEKIRDFFRDLIHKFKGNKSYKSLLNDLEYLNDRLERLAQSEENKKASATEGEEKYSIVALDNGNTYVKASRNVISGDNISEWRKQITSFFNELLDGGESLDITTIDGDVLTITKSETANKARDNYQNINGQRNRMSDSEFKVKLNAEAHIDEIAETSMGSQNKKSDTKSHNFAKDGFTYRTAYFQDFDGSYYRLKLSVGNNGTVATIYNVGKINKDSLPSLTKIVSVVGSKPLGKLSNDSISNSAENVKKNNSENTENYSESAQTADEKLSIPVTEMDKLLDKYDKGEITREEYNKAIDSRISKEAKRASEKYIADWEKKNGVLMRRTIEANEIREEAVRNERKEQAIRADRESSMYFIRRSVKRLNHALRANSKAKHIPESLKGAVTEFCRLFAENDTATFEHKDLADIAAYYKQLGDKKADRTKYDPFILERLDTLTELLPGKKLTELGKYELETVRTIADALNNAVKEEETIFLDGKRTKLEEAGNRTLKEIPTMKSKFPKLKKDFFIVGNAKPIYFFNGMPGDFGKAFQECLNGQDKFALKMVRGQEFIETTKADYNYDTWKNKILTFEVQGGEVYKITVEQALQLVATAERQRTNEVQAAEHLNVGGVVFDTELLKKVYKAQKKVDKAEKSSKKKSLDSAKNELKRAVEKLQENPIQLTFGDIDNLSKKLTDDQKNYMKAFVDFLSTDCAAWGNEVTMEMYGYRQYNEENYFPYVSAKEFLYSDPAAGTDNALRHASFTNSLQRHANNPLVISSFTDVAVAHIEQMASYNAMTAPVETLNKLFNYKTEAVAATDGNSGIPSRSVKAELTLKFGEAAADYIENFIRDVNNGVRGDSRDSFVNALNSKFKKTAVLGNLSVIFQQPFAVIRACVDLDLKYMLLASKYNVKNNYEQMKQFAPVAIIKQMGSFDTGVGLKNSTWLSGEHTFMEGVDEFLGKGAEKADEIAWSFLWNACKAEIAGTTDLEVGSEAFLEAAGKRVSDLINRTQVYDSVLSKSQNMRNKGAAGALTSFMGEPTTEINMLYDAFTDLIQGKTGGKKVVRTVAALTSSALLTAIAQGLAYAMRDKDEDESFSEKWAYHSSANFVDNLNPLSKIPYIRDIFSIWDGYDVERQDISVVSDVVTAAKALTMGEPSFYKVRKLAEAVASLYGVPAKNVLRDIEATVRTFLQMFDDNTPTAEGIKESIFEGVSENDIIAIFTGKKS